MVDHKLLVIPKNMALTEEQLQVLQEFLRSHRSNEANFAAISQKLDEALSQAGDGTEFFDALEETKEKYGAAYATARENNGAAWPEFENFITHFERGIVAAIGSVKSET